MARSGDPRSGLNGGQGPGCKREPMPPHRLRPVPRRPNREASAYPSGGYLPQGKRQSKAWTRSIREQVSTSQARPIASACSTSRWDPIVRPSAPGLPNPVGDAESRFGNQLLWHRAYGTLAYKPLSAKANYRFRGAIAGTWRCRREFNEPWQHGAWNQPTGGLTDAQLELRAEDVACSNPSYSV